MTDLEPTEFSREQRAFSEAFTNAANGPAFEPLRLDQVRPVEAGVAGGFRRPRWLGVLPAAAALAAVVIAGAVVLNQPGPTAATSAGGLAAPAEGKPPARERAQDERALRILPAAEPGRRWVTYRDWAAQVPQEWGYGIAPRPDWCVAGRRFPQQPYVDPYGDRFPVRRIACAEPPASLTGRHLRFGAGEPPLPSGWVSQASEQVLDSAGARARVVYPDEPGEAARAGEILATLRQFDLDPNGCPVTHPIQDQWLADPSPAVALARVASVDEVAVCQYSLSTTGSDPGLLGSRVIAGRPATELVRALAQAPLGSGPNGGCADGKGSDALVLTIRGGGVEGEVMVRYSGCTHNGVIDAGGSRELTASACRPLFEAPVLPVAFRETRAAERCRATVSEP